MSWMGSYWFLRLDLIFSLNVDGMFLTNARASGSDPIQQPFKGKLISMNHRMAQESKEEQLAIDFPETWCTLGKCACSHIEYDVETNL